jgi:hypothetical protein
VKRKRKVMILVGAVAVPAIVFLSISGRELPEGMEAAQEVAQAYVDNLRSGDMAAVADAQATDFTAPAEDQLNQLESAEFVSLSEAVLSDDERRACVGGGIGDSRVTTDSVRVYLVFEEQTWRVVTLQAFSNSDPATPPWPSDWGGATITNRFVCGMGY